MQTITAFCNAPLCTISVEDLKEERRKKNRKTIPMYATTDFQQQVPSLCLSNTFSYGFERFFTFWIVFHLLKILSRAFPSFFSFTFQNCMEIRLEIKREILFFLFHFKWIFIFRLFFIQGFTVLVCFVIKAESKLKSDSLNKGNGKQIIEDYCSGSINSPLNCK